MKVDANDIPLCRCGHSAYVHVRVEDSPTVTIYPCPTPGCHCWNYCEGA